MTKKTTVDSVRAQLSAANKTAHGAWRFAFYPRDILPDLSGPVAASLATYLASIASQEIPRLCLTCETGFRHQRTVAAFSVLQPDKPGDVGGFISGVCSNCAQRPGLREMIRATYQAGFDAPVRIVEK